MNWGRFDTCAVVKVRQEGESAITTFVKTALKTMGFPLKMVESHRARTSEPLIKRIGGILLIVGCYGIIVV